MAEKVSELMTRDPIALSSDTSIVEAARRMRDSDVGAVLVSEGGTVTGLLTDRDITVRAVADGRDPDSTTAGEIASTNLTSLSPDDSIDDAIRAVRDQNVRRLPVLDNGRPVGILSIGDLAIERDADSALADISAAPGNR